MTASGFIALFTHLHPHQHTLSRHNNARLPYTFFHNTALPRCSRLYSPPISLRRLHAAKKMTRYNFASRNLRPLMYEISFLFKKFLNIAKKTFWNIMFCKSLKLSGKNISKRALFILWKYWKLVMVELESSVGGIFQCILYVELWYSSNL